MTLSDWMIPELSLSSQVQLESNKRSVRNHVEANPVEVAELACTLMTQITLQESIMRKATRRIAELELQELLNTPTEELQEVYILPGKVSLFMRILLRIAGHRRCLASVTQSSSS